MPPLEDELRTALHGRAATLTPLADPFPGVERRARGLRRRRAAASVAGTALAVLAVAGAVPLLTPDRASAPAPGEVAASAAPSAAPSDPPEAAPFVLDPLAPWAYRGVALSDGDRDTLQAAWQARYPGARTVPLFGQVFEPSARTEVVVLARGSGPDRWGVLQASEAGWTIVHDDALRTGTHVLAAALAGDGGERVLVVADPDVATVEYTPDASVGNPPYTALAPLADGVATGAVTTSTPDDDQVRGLAGEVVFVAEVPPLQGDGLPEGSDAAPANVLGWGPRGTAVDPELVSRAQDLLAANRADTAPGDVEGAVLFSGDDDAGRRYLIGQFWVPGDDEAETIAIVLTADGDEPQLYRPATSDTAAVALYLSPVNEQSRGELVVVPQPGTGQVQYAGDDAGEWVDKSTEGLDGVVLFERNPEAERTEGPDDRVRLLDGDGRVTATVSVRDLLCGTTSCS